ncbi:hypothetical protein GCM10009798_42960 [Nocardioides panacihumi]|uniref:RDD family protein n=1 Tax=Nocardioides panacihumi TaxID=400774 RepID=A0ABN2RYG7_9ACTN
MTQSSPPGWHPDPAGPMPGRPLMLRYWDGTTWTEHVAPLQPSPQPYGQPFGQAPQPFGEPYAGPTTADGQRLSGWWWRVLAYLIDSVTLSVVSNLLSLPAQASMRAEFRTMGDAYQRRLDANPDDPQIGWLVDHIVNVLHDHALALYLPSLVVVTLYHCVMLRWKGATLGKLAVGLRVRTREAPGRLPWSAIAIRVAVQFLIPGLLIVVGFASGSVGPLVGLYLAVVVFQLLDGLWPLWDRQRQAIHDKAAGTVVIRIR